MRRFGLVSILLISMLGVAAPAHADCVLMDTLGKLHTIQSRLARDPGSALFATDIRQIRGMSSGISDRATLDAVDGNRFTGHGADFIRFLQNTRSLLQSASLDDPQSIRMHFGKSTRDNLAEISQHLRDLQCTDEQVAVDTRAAAERRRGGDSDADDLAEVAENLKTLANEVFQLRTLAIAAAVVMVVMAALPILRRWRILQRRRAKRHNTTYETPYKWNGRETGGMLIDINCFGTKLRHATGAPLPQGSDIEIAICNQWIAGTVMWGNAHYSGVQFGKSISLSAVEQVRASSQAAETQNGAPKDAA